ncbi:MAG TPA: LytTR family DNA-binding domain-containing protein, partial [Gemmatimonadaceae bacterium]
LLEIEQVAWLESAGNLVRVHSGNRVYLVRTTMDRLAARLAGRDTFVRVRRSAIINVRAIATLERYDKGSYVVQLRDGTKIISSRYYQPALRRLLHSDR